MNFSKNKKDKMSLRSVNMKSISRAVGSGSKGLGTTVASSKPPKRIELETAMFIVDEHDMWVEQKHYDPAEIDKIDYMLDYTNVVYEPIIE
jgi:hypothetical protein